MRTMRALTRLYTRRYDRRAQRDHAVAAHQFGSGAGRRRAIRAPGDRAGAGIITYAGPGDAGRRHGRAIPVTALSGDAFSPRHRHLPLTHARGMRPAHTRRV